MVTLQNCLLYSSVAFAFAEPNYLYKGKPMPSTPTVNTSSGIIKGIIHRAQPNVRQFVGAPFAQQPVDSLRWEPPQRLPQSASSDVVEATKLPPDCPQYLTTIGRSVYKNDVLQFNLQGVNTTGTTSEACLTLSVWAPLGEKQERNSNSDDALLSVLVFTNGGAFVNGGQNVPYQLPPQWIQQSQDHIVVSFNYRFNIFGYPNTADLDKQNLGTLDQHMAVQWLQHNI